MCEEILGLDIAPPRIHVILIQISETYIFILGFRLVCNILEIFKTGIRRAYYVKGYPV